VLAREIAPRLSEALKRPVIVENRAGAAGNIGAAYVARTAPEGTLLLASQPMLAINPMLFKDMGYEPKELVPVTEAVDVVMVAVVNSSLPVHTLAEFVDYAKTHKVAFGTSGVGTPMHLAGLRLQRLAGFAMTHVAYRGAAPNITDLIGGNIQLSIVDYATARPFADQGKLRILGVGTPSRVPAAPGLPALRESVPGFDITSWFAFCTSARTPRDEVGRLAAALEAVMKEPKLHERLAAMGMLERAEGPQALARLVQQDIAVFGPVIRDNGVTVE
jgi:tripartite-type tricarboxylate transporter receptor subunit TctC